jgi:hypothetical protein
LYEFLSANRELCYDIIHVSQPCVQWWLGCLLTHIWAHTLLTSSRP